LKTAIIRFLGTNCDMDCKYACDAVGAKSEFVWYEETTLKGFDIVILPGGFSYGDYLRSGVLAKFSPIMQAVKEFAKYGGKIIGICNGFQILTESHLLPGTLLKNKNLRFIHKEVYLKKEESNCFFTQKVEKNILKLPIAHGDGNYFCSNDELKTLEDNSMIVLRYSSKYANTNEEFNPNGSIKNIAGICNKNGNIFGLMPHPERAVGDLGIEGEEIFRSFI